MFQDRLHHFPGHPAPMLDHPLSEEILPDVQPEAPLVQVETIFSCPVTGFLGAEASPPGLQAPLRWLQRAVKPTESPFCQAKECQFP